MTADTDRLAFGTDLGVKLKREIKCVWGQGRGEGQYVNGSCPSRHMNLDKSPQGRELPLTSSNCWEKRWSQPAARVAGGS